MRSPLISTAVGVLALLSPAPAQNVKQELQQKLATVKESIGRNQAALRQYSWTEHTDILLKGDVKSTKDNLCRYGADGKVQKTPVGTPAPKKEMRGVKGRIAERKIEDLTEYMERAAALIHRYMPPSPDKMQAVFQAGNAGLGQAGPGKIELQLRDYEKPGDSLTFSFDSTTKALTKIAVSSYLDEKDDAVTLDVNFQNLPDGVNYTASTVLNAAAKNVTVKVTNANYQKLAK
ncbi:MAG: hypothetical protein MUC42_05220 [Bryobacter sp.]|jgi:hypothetical protein|nr:hypothetical protein [Bryobacter sp.]